MKIEQKIPALVLDWVRVNSNSCSRIDYRTLDLEGESDDNGRIEIGRRSEWEEGKERKEKKKRWRKKTNKMKRLVWVKKILGAYLNKMSLNKKN